MPRKLHLTWDKTNKRWKKFYKGKQYYFPFGTTKADLKGYEKALSAWEKKKLEIDGEGSEDDSQGWQRLILQALEAQRVCETEDTVENRQRWLHLASCIASYQRMIQDGIRWTPDIEVTKAGFPLVFFDLTDVPPPWATPEQATIAPEKTIKGNVQRFLERKKREKTHGTYDRLRIALEAFTGFVGEHRPMEEITPALLQSYRDRLQERLDDSEDRMKTTTRANTLMQAVTQFVRWAYRQGALEDLPRNLEDLPFPKEERAIATFSEEEVSTLLGEASESLKLHLLLMLNCGMTQQDVSDLKQTEVDWKAGRITRKRSKTKNHGEVPEVTYKLWAETFTLLKKQRSKDPELVLLNRNGAPWANSRIDDSGKVVRSDGIKNAYFRLCKKLADRKEDPVKIEKPLKVFRKTAATKLGGHPEFGKWAQHYLGHSPRTVADKHYVRPNEEQFDRAMVWLGEQFGFKS